MLVFDNNLLADYLDGKASAKRFLEQHETDDWAVPSVALYEAYMGTFVVDGRGSVDDVYTATRQFEILPVTDGTAREAAELQQRLQSSGVRLSALDALIATTALEQDARFATNDSTFWKEEVCTEVDVVRYERE